jgi:hypothetical protein
MTRFWVRTDIEATERELRDLFEMMNYGIKMTTPGILTAHTTDRWALDSLLSPPFVIDVWSLALAR